MAESHNSFIIPSHIIQINYYPQWQYRSVILYSFLVISRVGRADPMAWVPDSTRTKSEETVLPWSVVTSARDTDISTLAMMSRRSDSDILDSEPDYQSNNNAILPEKESTTSLASGCHVG